MYPKLPLIENDGRRKDSLLVVKFYSTAADLNVKFQKNKHQNPNKFQY